jgi:hypothetical protein
MRMVKDIVIYIGIIRKLEKLLNLQSRPFLPARRPGWEGRWYWLPIFFPLTPTPLELGIHEIRHRLQMEENVPLLTEKDIESLSLPKLKVMIQKMKKEGRNLREIDAEIVEQIGGALLRQRRIKEFRELMLRSKVPSTL